MEARYYKPSEQYTRPGFVALYELQFFLGPPSILPSELAFYGLRRTWNTAWFKKMDSISYIYISWTIHGMRIIYITFETGGPNFQIPPLERSPSAQPCSSVSWEQNGDCAAQALLVLHSSHFAAARLCVESIFLNHAVYLKIQFVQCSKHVAAWL
jgi:hypothetical protein